MSCPLETAGWGTVLDFAYIGIALLAAFYLRSQLRFLQKQLLPSCLIAGLLILFFGPSVLKVYTFSGNIEAYVYHLLTAVFATLSLRGFRHQEKGRAVLVTTGILCQGMALQAVLGIAFTLLWIIFLVPHLFPTFGFQMMLGYSFDSSLAQNLALQWEQMGFVGGRYSGLSFAVMGFFWAYLLGIIMINRGRKHNLISAYHPQPLPAEVLSGLWGRGERRPEAGRMTTTGQSIETLTFHLAVIGGIIFITYISMNLFTSWLRQYSPLTAQLSDAVWSLNFLFAVILGSAARSLFKGLRIDHLLDGGLLTRTGGFFTDLAVVTSIASIPVIFYRSYWIKVLILSFIGAAATLFAVYWLTSKLHGEFSLERTLASFGLLTGNISTGLALLRAVDPEMTSPVSRDLAYAGGLAFIFGLPLLVLTRLSLAGAIFGQPVRYLLITLALLGGYIALISLIWLFLKLRKNHKEPKHPVRPLIQKEVLR